MESRPFDHSANQPDITETEFDSWIANGLDMAIETLKELGKQEFSPNVTEALLSESPLRAETILAVCRDLYTLRDTIAPELYESMQKCINIIVDSDSERIIQASTSESIGST